MLARLVWLRFVCFAAVAASPFLHTPKAHAAGDDDGGQKAGDDDGGQGDDSGGGGDDDDDSGATSDKDQPKVTAGGLFVINTYPLSEVERPLTMTQGIIEARLQPGFDLSAGQTFERGALAVLGRYGLADNFELDAGGTFTMFAPNPPSDGSACPSGLCTLTHSVFVGMETSILYNMLDFRVAAELPISPKVDFDIPIGFPVKYRINDKIAIIGLEKLFTIHFDAKPDLTVTVGGMFSPIPILSLIARATVNLVAFDTNNGLFIPVEIDAQLALSSQFDIGLAAQLTNLKPPTGSPIDGRELDLFARARF